MEKKLEEGYYWVKWKDERFHTKEIFIAIYENDEKPYPWQIIACDEIFRESELIPLKRVEDYKK